MQSALWSQAIMLRTASAANPSDAEIPMSIEIMDNKIFKGDYEISNNITIELLESEKTAYGNTWHTN